MDGGGRGSWTQKPRDAWAGAEPGDGGGAELLVSLAGAGVPVPTHPHCPAGSDSLLQSCLTLYSIKLSFCSTSLLGYSPCFPCFPTPNILIQRCTCSHAHIDTCRYTCRHMYTHVCIHISHTHGCKPKGQEHGFAGWWHPCQLLHLVINEDTRSRRSHSAGRVLCGTRKALCTFNLAVPADS